MRLSYTEDGKPTLMKHFCKRCGGVMMDKDFDMTWCDPCRPYVYHENVKKLATRGVPMMLAELGRVAAMIGPGIHHSQKVIVS